MLLAMLKGSEIGRMRRPHFKFIMETGADDEFEVEK
jgi:hypothetical protein